MRKILSAILNVARREWTRLKAAPGSFLLIFGIPAVAFPIVAAIYMNGVVRDMPVAVFDGDKSELSRMLVRSLDASSAFQVAEEASSVAEIRSLFRQGRIKAAFAIPNGMERDIKRGESSDVVVYNDATNLIQANLTLKESSTVIRTVAAGIGIKQLRSRGMTEDQARRAVMPIRVQAQSLYNPTYNYADYLVTGLVPALFQLTVMITAVLLICGEEADGSLGELIHEAQGSAAAIVIGKVIPLFFCHFATSIVIVGLLYPIFGISVSGSTIGVLSLFLMLIAASLALGVFISSIVRDRMLATEVALFINLPAFVISGYIFPFRAMPWPYVAFANLLPYTHFLKGFVTVGRMGLPLSDTASAAAALFLLIITAGTGSIILLRLRIASPAGAGTSSLEEL